MRNAWCSLDSPATQSGAMGSRVGRALLPSPKSRWAGSPGVSLPATSNSSSAIPFVHSLPSLASSRDDVRPARSSSERDSSPSSSGQGQKLALAPGPRWREELSDLCPDNSPTSSSVSQPGPSGQGQLLRPVQERPNRERGRRDGKTAAGRESADRLPWDRRGRGSPQSKKLRRGEASQPLSADQGYSSSDSSGGRPSRSELNLKRLSGDWRDDDEFKAAVQLNRTIAAMTSAEEVLGLVEAHGHVFTSVNAATAFHRLAKVWP